MWDESDRVGHLIPEQSNNNPVKIPGAAVISAPILSSSICGLLQLSYRPCLAIGEGDSLIELGVGLVKS